jgi:hypothetical protein
MFNVFVKSLLYLVSFSNYDLSLVTVDLDCENEML